MKDIKFDTATNDIVIEDGDFALESDVSQTNGTLILKTSHAFIQSPLLGVGIDHYINSSLDKLRFELNRWQNQCFSDGAKEASWDTNTDTEGNVIYSISTRYE